MAICNSYVKLPEGIRDDFSSFLVHQQTENFIKGPTLWGQGADGVPSASLGLTARGPDPGLQLQRHRGAMLSAPTLVEPPKIGGF